MSHGCCQKRRSAPPPPNQSPLIVVIFARTSLATTHIAVVRFHCPQRYATIPIRPELLTVSHQTHHLKRNVVPLSVTSTVLVQTRYTAGGAVLFRNPGTKAGAFEPLHKKLPQTPIMRWSGFINPEARGIHRSPQHHDWRSF